ESKDGKESKEDRRPEESTRDPVEAAREKAMIEFLFERRLAAWHPPQTLVFVIDGLVRSDERSVVYDVPNSKWAEWGDYRFIVKPGVTIRAGAGAGAGDWS